MNVIILKAAVLRRYPFKSNVLSIKPELSAGVRRRHQKARNLYQKKILTILTTLHLYISYWNCSIHLV